MPCSLQYNFLKPMCQILCVNILLNMFLFVILDYLEELYSWFVHEKGVSLESKILARRIDQRTISCTIRIDLQQCRC